MFGYYIAIMFKPYLRRRCYKCDTKIHILSNYIIKKNKAYCSKKCLKII